MSRPSNQLRLTRLAIRRALLRENGHNPDAIIFVTLSLYPMKKSITSSLAIAGRLFSRLFLLPIVIVAFIFALSGALDPLRAAPPIPIVTATDAVFYMDGYVSAGVDVQAILATPPGSRPYSLRTMAEMNKHLAYLFYDKSLFALFLFGRADRFDEAADAAGEPPFGST